MKTQNRQCYLVLAAVALNVLSAIQASPGKQEIGSRKSEKEREPMNNSTAPEEIIEILTLDIKPGRRDEFHKTYVTNSVPLLKKWNFNLVAYGPSLHDANSYYVIRAFKSLDDRQVSEDAFYNSTEWQQGPRNAILELVDHFAYAVVSAEMWKKVAESGL